jgi:hypothetical protein
MPAGSKSCRLSILAIDEAERLRSAIGALLDRGVGPDQLGIVGYPSVFDDLARDAAATDRQDVDSVISHRREPIQLAGDTRLELCGSPLLSAILRAPATADGPLGRMAIGDTLTEQAKMGATLLLVAADSAEQHAHIARTLLRHGRHSLQTFEFTVPSRRDVRGDHHGPGSEHAADDHCRCR